MNVQTDQATLLKELEEIRIQLHEANETIDAIRTGQIDALVVQGQDGHQIYTLKTADQTYRVFIEKMAEGAVTVSRDGLILYCNNRFASMVQKPLSEVIGFPFENFIYEADKPAFRAVFDASWEDDGKQEMQLIAGDQKVPVQLSLTTLALDDGISLSIIITNLTQQKEIQRQLQENNFQLAQLNHALEASNHDLQQFASIASHDLQEPLRKIQMFSNLVRDKAEGLTPEIQGFLKKVIDSSIRMKALIIDILDYSKLSADHIHSESVDLNTIITELKEDFELIMTEKKAEIISGELPSLYVNRGQLRQVFQNIISNALKFSTPGVPPVVEISARHLATKSFDSPMQENGPWCMICIKDNGIGFDQKYVDNIFSLFLRLNTKDKYEGTGIGLAIAKKIIEKHNGLISAVSEKGKGAEFRIVLPCG